MTVAPTLERYLMDQGTTYQLLSHPQTQTAAETAHASHISGSRLAKGVLLADGNGYLLAVLPASHHLDLERVAAWLGRPVSLASEQEVGRLFPDCELGAIPAVGWAYGLDVILDDSLTAQDIFGSKPAIIVAWSRSVAIGFASCWGQRRMVSSASMTDAFTPPDHAGR